MLESVLRYLNNWFLVPDGIHDGAYTIEGGGIALPFLAAGQCFRIVGSVFNDGVYQYPAHGLTQESFDGSVWALAVPKYVTELAEEIEAWQEKNAGIALNPYTSESFGGYSYSRATGKNGGALTWQDAFAAQLTPYRKLPGNYAAARPTRAQPRHYSRPFDPDHPWR